MPGIGIVSRLTEAGCAAAREGIAVRTARIRMEVPRASEREARRYGGRTACCMKSKVGRPGRRTPPAAAGGHAPTPLDARHAHGRLTKPGCERLPLRGGVAWRGRYPRERNGDWGAARRFTPFDRRKSGPRSGWRESRRARSERAATLRLSRNVAFPAARAQSPVEAVAAAALPISIESGAIAMTACMPGMLAGTRRIAGNRTQVQHTDGRLAKPVSDGDGPWLEL